VGLVTAERTDQPVGFIGHDRGLRNREIQLAPADHGHDADRVTDHDAGPRARAVTGHPSDCFCHNQLGWIRAASDGKRRRVDAVEKLDFARQIVGPRQQIARLLHEQPSDVGQLRTAPGSMEQLSVQALLERLDAARECRLRDVLGLRGPCEAAELRERAGMAQQPKVDVHAGML